MISSRYKPSFVAFGIGMLGIMVILLISAARFNAALLLTVFFPGLLLFISWRRFFFLRILPDRLSIYLPFKSREIFDTDIQSILLWGRKKVSYGYVDAVTIIASDGMTTQLADIVCENMPEIRQLLLKRFPGLVRDAPVYVNRRVLDDGQPESFRGNFFLTGNAIPVCIFSLFIGLSNLFLHLPLAGRLITVLPLFIMWMLLGSQLFYFRLTADALEVRNQFFPWTRKCWPVDDIYNILFEFREGRGTTNILRVHTNDLRSKEYVAIGLRDRDWLALGIALQKRGIPVKNGLIGVHLPEPGPQTPGNAG